MSSTDGIPSAGPTVLVIEPDPAAALRIGGCLMCAGLQAHVIASGQQTDRAAGDVEWAAAVINTDTPGLATDRLVERLQFDLDVPVVLLGCFADESERVGWMNRGVDDFVPPPSSLDEVVARVCSVLRRRRPHHDEPPITVGPLVLDEATRRVLVSGQPVSLSPMEFKLLRHLAAEPGRVFSREELLRDVWGYTTAGTPPSRFTCRRCGPSWSLAPGGPG